MIDDPYHFYEPDMNKPFATRGKPMCRCGQHWECFIHFELEKMLAIREAKNNDPNRGTLYR